MFIHAFNTVNTQFIYRVEKMQVPDAFQDSRQTGKNGENQPPKDPVFGAIQVGERFLNNARAAFTKAADVPVDSVNAVRRTVGTRGINEFDADHIDTQPLNLQRAYNLISYAIQRTHERFPPNFELTVGPENQDGIKLYKGGKPILNIPADAYLVSDGTTVFTQGGAPLIGVRYEKPDTREVVTGYVPLRYLDEYWTENEQDRLDASIAHDLISNARINPEITMPSGVTLVCAVSQNDDPQYAKMMNVYQGKKPIAALSLKDEVVTTGKTRYSPTGRLFVEVTTVQGKTGFVNAEIFTVKPA